MTLKDYCQTDSERELIDAMDENGGSVERAARALDKDSRNKRKQFARIKQRASQKGYDPTVDLNWPVAAHERLKERSVLVDEEGGQRLTWYKTTEDGEKLKASMREAISAFSEELPKSKPVKPPKSADEDLLNLFVITDYHVGMLAWADETGADWDVDIAEETIIQWFQLAIDAAPKAQKAVFGQVGDFQHFDSLLAITPTHGHILDADTRYANVVRTVIRIARRVIQMLLENYPEVHVIWSDANHDPASAILHREWLSAHFENEPRCYVDDNPDTYNCVEWGLVSLFFHHGHKRKVTNVSEVFTQKFREVFGRTKFSYAHTGHLHHRDLKEFPTMVVEQHRTLAAPDAHSSQGGFMSGRDAAVITYHKRFGEASRNTISFDLVQASQA